MGAVAPATGEGVSLSGYRFHITKQNADITQDILGSYQTRGIGSIKPILPYCTSDGAGLTAPINSLFEAFNEITSADILASQISIHFTSESPDLGSGGYLTILDNSPFITFDSAPDLLLPIGKGFRMDAIKRAPFIELLFAGHVISALHIVDKDGSDILKKGELRENYLGYFYEEQNLAPGSLRWRSDFEKDVANAIRGGFVQRKYVMGDLDYDGTYDQIPVLSQVGDFSWLL